MTTTTKTTSAERAEQYGDALADVYDLMYPWQEGPVVANRLAGLVPEGSRVLELGVGSGRIALPLAAQGHRVHGIEASGRMLDLLSHNDSDGLVTTTQGDIATTVTEVGAFDLVYIVCNTLFMLPPEAQVDVFCRAAEHLKADGRLVVEVYDPRRFHGLDAPLVQTRHLAADILMVDTITAAPVDQVLVVVHSLIRSGRVETYVEHSAYRWPAELDLLARLTGFRREHRHGDWQGEAFTAAAERHISVYRRHGMEA